MSNPNKIDMSLSDIINNSKDNEEVKETKKRNYNPNMIDRPRGIERRRFDRHSNNKFSNKINNQPKNFNQNNQNNFRKPRVEEMSYRLLKIDNLNITMTNEDLRVSLFLIF